MIVFKILARKFIVLIVISSIKDIYAPLPERKMNDTDIRRRLCYDRINNAFQGNSVHEHAIYAINNYSGHQNLDGDSYAYFSSLEQNTNISSVPASEDFCRNYVQISRELCQDMVTRMFGTTPRQALSMVYYFYRQDKINSIYETYKLGLFQRYPTYADNSQAFPNLMMDFWNSILERLLINTVLRRHCVTQIDIVFQDNDLLGKAKIAFEYIIQNYENRCYIPRIKYHDRGHVFAYYMEFKDYLLSNDIPTTREFCDEYIGIVDDIDDCVKNLNQYYSSDKHEALIKMFYKLHNWALPSILSKKLDGRGYIDMPLEYFYRVKYTFKLKTGDGGMLPPKEFCEKLHSETQE